MAVQLLRFKRAREKRKLSRASVCEQTGLSVHVVTLADSGKKIERAAAEKLAAALGVKVVSLK